MRAILTAGGLAAVLALATAAPASATVISAHAVSGVLASLLKDTLPASAPVAGATRPAPAVRRPSSSTRSNG